MLHFVMQQVVLCDAQGNEPLPFLYLHLSAMKIYRTPFEPLWLSLCWTRSFKFIWWLRKHGFLLQSFPSTSKIPLPGTVLVATGLNLRIKQVYSYTPRYIFWNTSYMQLQTYRTQALILDLRSLRIKRYTLLLGHIWSLDFNSQTPGVHVIY